MAKYVNAHKELVEYINANKERLHCEAVGNFVVFVGDEDQFIHVWRFDEGYRGIDKTLNAFDGDQGTLFHVLFFGDQGCVGSSQCIDAPDHAQCGASAPGH